MTKKPANARRSPAPGVSRSDDVSSAWLTRGASAKALGVSVAMIRKWEGLGTLAPRKIGGVHYFDPADVELLRARRQGKPIRLTDEHATAARVFDELNAKRDPVSIVLKLRLHPDVVEELTAQFHRMMGAIVLAPSDLETIAAATGAFKRHPVTAADWIDAFAEARKTASALTLSQCVCVKCRVEPSRFCSSCSPSRSASPHR